MSHVPTVKLDPGENLKLVMRKARAGELIFRFFTDEDHTVEYPIEDDFQLNIKKSSKSPTADILQFTSVGATPTITITDNEIRIPYDEDDSDIDRDVAWFELYNVDTKQNWFQGKIEIVTGEAPDDTVEEADVTINLETTLNVQVTVMGFDPDAVTEAQAYTLWTNYFQYFAVGQTPPLP